MSIPRQPPAPRSRRPGLLPTTLATALAIGLLAALGLGLLWPAPAGAEAGARRHQLRYTSFTALRLNPDGLQSQLDLAWRFKLYDSDSVLFRTGFLEAGATTTISPGLLRVGGLVQIEPIAVLQLSARMERVQYFGTVGYLQSFDDVDDDTSDSALDAGDDLGLEYATGGWRLSLSGIAQGKLGPLAVRSRLTAFHHAMDLRAGDTLWYDPSLDILTPRTGWTLTVDTDVLLTLLDSRLILGARHTLTRAWYSDAAYGAAGRRDTDATPTHRVGPLIAWRFFDRPGKRFNAPTILALVNWHLVHPSRTGQDVKQSIPYVVIGFAFSGDLLE